MKKHIVLFLIICFAFQVSIAQENNRRNQNQNNNQKEQTIRRFERTLENARDRISKLQETAPLRREVTYEKEEEVLRKANQLLELLKEGNDVNSAELAEMEKKLKTMGTDKSPRPPLEKDPYGKDYEQAGENTRGWEQSRQRSEEVFKSGEETVENNRRRIEEARKKLEQQRNNNQISDGEYNSRMKRIDQAEKRINSLEEKIRREKDRLDNLNNRITEGRNN